MNKSELIADISVKTKMTKQDVGLVIEHFVTNVTQCLQSGEQVQLLGFGTFETRKRPEKMGRNPRTGQPVQIPERTAVVFRPGKILKSAVE